MTDKLIEEVLQKSRRAGSHLRVVKAFNRALKALFARSEQGCKVAKDALADITKILSEP